MKRFLVTPLQVAHNFSQPTHNSYGLITGPYNNNDARVLTRALSVCGLPTTSHPLPGCAPLLDTFQQDTMRAFDSVSETMHGQLHVQLGGAWGCTEDLRTYVDVHPAIAAAFASTFQTDYAEMLMVLSASTELTCPGYCSEDTPFDDCRCSCPFLDHSPVNLTEFTQRHLEVAST